MKYRKGIARMFPVIPFQFLILSYTGIPCMSTKFTQKTYKFSFIS